MKILTKKDIKGLYDLLNLQYAMLSDDYMVGLYNGMECIIAILEERENKPLKSNFRHCILNNPNNKNITLYELESRKEVEE